MDKKKKFFPASILIFVIYIITGFFASDIFSDQFAAMESQLHFFDIFSVSGIFIYLLLIYIFLFIAFFLNIIIHEAGHLVFGLLSGYTFTSFRIMSFMWIRENGKIKFKRYTLKGTGGQCLMCPPDIVDGRIPVVLYNLGGSLMNIIAGLLFWAVSYLFGGIPALVAILQMTAVLGFTVALINGIPMRLPMTVNDGYNALSLKKNSKALNAFWIQLKVNNMLAKGYRIKDMPEEWFVFPTDEELQNSMISTVGVLCCNRLMDEHRFEEAESLMAHLIETDVLLGIHRVLITCDRIYCEIMGKNRRAFIEELRTQEQLKAMKAMKRSVTTLRTDFAYVLNCQFDVEKANKIKERFEKTVKKYPYPSDAESERELIYLAEQQFKR